MKTKPRHKRTKKKQAAPLPPVSDVRTIRIIGTDAAGKTVAEDRTAEHWKASQIAAGWNGSGLAVEIIDRVEQ